MEWSIFWLKYIIKKYSSCFWVDNILSIFCRILKKFHNRKIFRRIAFYVWYKWNFFILKCFEFFLFIKNKIFVYLQSIQIPTRKGENNTRTFQFTLSSIQGDPNGSFDCLEQTYSRFVMMAILDIFSFFLSLFHPQNHWSKSDMHLIK